MAGYTREDIVNKLDKALINVSTLYQQDFINYRGKTTDTGEKYSEIISGILLENLQVFKNIIKVKRNNSYRVMEHNGITLNNQSNRVEERIALNMFQKSYPYIGEIIDYQIPLKGKQADKGVGKVDLLSKKDDKLIILELKKEDSKETLLRCVLEAATYIRQIDPKKLLEDYKVFNVNEVGTAVLVFENQAQHEEYKRKDSYVVKLMKDLNVDLFVIDHMDELQVNGVALP